MFENVSNLQKTIQSLIKAADNQECSVEQIKQEFSTFLMQDSEQTTAAMEVIEDELTCSVCLEVVLQACVTTCKHLFCKSCLGMCLLERKYCPMCRFDLSEPPPGKLLPKIDGIVEIAMSHTNEHYISWAREEIMQRYAKYGARYNAKKEMSEFSEEIVGDSSEFESSDEDESDEDESDEDVSDEDESDEDESDEDEYDGDASNSSTSDNRLLPNAAIEVTRRSRFETMWKRVWKLLTGCFGNR